MKAARLLWPAIALVLLSCQRPSERSGNANAPAPGADAAHPALIVVLAEEPDQLVPPLSRSPASAAIWPWILPSLVRVEGDTLARGNVVGDLASSWEFAEDGRSARFRLVRDRLWEDTTVVSVKDVVGSYGVYKDPALAGRWPSRLSDIVAVEEDPAEQGAVRFRFRSPLSRARILQLAALPIFSAEQWSTTRDRRAPLGSAALPVLTAGPFRIQEWRAGESLRLERHPFPPPGRSAGVDRLHLRFLASARSRALQVEHGIADLALDLPPGESARLKDDDSSARIVRAGPAGIEALAWNLEDLRWGRVALRRYLWERIDRAGVRRALAAPEDSATFAWGEPCEGFLSAAPDTSDTSAVSDTLWLRTDLAAPTLELLYDRSDAVRERIAVELSLQLDRLGIRCRLDPAPADVCAQRIAARRFQAALVGWTIASLPDVGEVYGSAGAFNFAGLADAEVDRLIAEARGGAADTLPDAWQRIESRAREELPYLFLFRRVRVDAVGPRVRAYRPDPLQPCSDLLSLRRD